MNEPIAQLTCACGWPRPLIAVTNADGSLPSENLTVIYDCPQCRRSYSAGEVSVRTAARSPRANFLAAHEYCLACSLEGFQCSLPRKGHGPNHEAHGTQGDVLHSWPALRSWLP